MNDNGPVSNFLDGVEKNLQDEGAPPIMFGPEWALETHGAGEPPDDLDNLIWSEETGWTEKNPTADYVLCLYTDE